jgi:histone H3/H4
LSIDDNEKNMQMEKVLEASLENITQVGAIYAKHAGKMTIKLNYL